MASALLNFYTDLEDTRALQYILTEFKRIQKANFDIALLPLGKGPESLAEGVYHLAYSKQKSGDSTVWIKSDWGSKEALATQELLSALADNSPIDLQKTDLLWPAFALLSRLLEYQSETEGILIKSYSQKLTVAPGTFDQPSVNHMFDRLEQFLKTQYNGLGFDEPSAPVIELSHDLDYLYKTPQLRIKQSVFHFYNAVKSLNRPAQSLGLLGKSLRFFVSNSQYWNFDYWESVEKKASMRSIFYVYAMPQRQRTFRSWLIDPSYAVAQHQDLANELKRLKHEGFEIGLHGSYASAESTDYLIEEKAVLEKSLGFEVSKTRQHWLNFNEKITAQSHSQLFEQDSTIGWNDRMGFRAGVASRYHPFDHQHQKAFDHWVVPQVVMDSQLFDYAQTGLPEKIEEMMLYLDRSTRVKSAHVSFSWHPRTCSPEYSWHAPYELLLSRVVA